MIQEVKRSVSSGYVALVVLAVAQLGFGYLVYTAIRENYSWAFYETAVDSPGDPLPVLENDVPKWPNAGRSGGKRRSGGSPTRGSPCASWDRSRSTRWPSSTPPTTCS